jgi:Zn-dependent protease with chaperone function
MRVIQVISLVLLIGIGLLKFNLLDGSFINKNVIHYFFNATMILTIFSIVFPKVSNIKLKKAKIEDNNLLIDMLQEIDPNSNIEIYTSRNHLSKNAASLYKENSLVIVCGEELINILNYKQLKFVIAHEYYHIKNNHLIKNILSFVFVVALVPAILILLNLFMGNWFPALPTIIISAVIYICSFILHFVYSQHREYAADRFAASLVGSHNAKTTLKILGDNNLIVEKKYTLFETHPSMNKRIQKVS